MKSSNSLLKTKRDEPHQGQNRRFEEACELMRKNAAKFLEQDILNDSSSEEELDDSAILEKTFLQYSGAEGNLSLEKTREFLQDILTSGAVVCLICIESIKRTEKIWSCRHCFGILHLHCIQKWAKDSLYNVADSEVDRKKRKWCCPKCRSEYTPSEETFKYVCFCGKVENPVNDVWSVPHSCGKPCEKKFTPGCGHTCCLLCHPGSCPPCPKTVFVSCCCAKSKPISQRCSNKEWSCGKICSKLLSCNLHRCAEICHKGECPPCQKQREQKCFCGSKTKLRPCENPTWKCDKICKRLLDCKNHLCQVVCHEGPCPACPNSGPRPCPCGKKITSAPCTENVEPCGDTCNKILGCGLHRCTQRCHFGSCEKCLQMRIMKCRCGQREKSVPCCKEITCDIKCKRRRDCGRHNCNRKCCVGNCPPCEAICGKTLNCGSHKCASICHSGPCYPCRETLTIKCNCGLSTVVVPCGRKGTVPPRCSADCKLPADCHHPQRHKHQCHFGSCPPCRLICGKVSNCGHICPIRCHSAVLTKIQTKEKKDGPWDLLNCYKIELICKPCPPCAFPLPVACLGNHEVRNIPCHEARPRSCGRPCGRKLFCGNHTCSLECHAVSSAADSQSQGVECESCFEICTKPRKPGCSHPCVRPCHPEACSSCQQRIRMKCHCQINTIYAICSEWLDADDVEKTSLLSCGNRCPKQILCGHRCTLQCHAGQCSSIENCKKKVTIRCPCKRRKKEIQCYHQLKNENLQCDNECLELQETEKAKELEKELKRKAEEDKKREQELQEFLKKTEGKKKKKKKLIEKETKYNFFTSRTLLFCATMTCILGALTLHLNFM